MDPIAPQVIQEGELLVVEVSASDDDGPAPLTLSQTNNLPGGTDFLIDDGSGAGEFSWTSSAGDASGSPYSVTVTATDGEGASDSVTFSVTVVPAGGSTHAQLFSTSANRSNPQALDGATVDGQIYVFVEPEDGIERVEFFIDGVLRQTEGYAPYDLAGGTTTSANPFDTSTLSDGTHIFSARIYMPGGGSETVSAEVQVGGPVEPADYNLMVSQTANRSDPEVLLDGDTVDGLIYVFVEPEDGIERVEFFIDGILRQTEGYAPYDLAGTSGSLALPFNTGSLSNESHTFSARITTDDGIETISANLLIAN